VACRVERMSRRGAGEGGIKIPREAGGEDGRGRKHARKEEHESGMAVAVGQVRARACVGAAKR
jgi:hypothetical protein